ncbi:MAG: hypothetical protein OHK0017_08250 [Patescibacteria group bacterium]
MSLFFTILSLLVLLFSSVSGSTVTSNNQKPSSVDSASTFQDKALPNTIYYKEAKITAPVIESELSDLFESDSKGQLDFNRQRKDDTPVQNLLAKGAVHLAFSPAPGEIGNSYLVGNRNSNLTEELKIPVTEHSASFRFLNLAKKGDVFYIYDKQGKKLSFKVFETITTSTTDSATAYANFENRRVVTLQTTTYNDLGKENGRLLVRGELLE